tara:strand:+ start:416 stop:919 length:504 start_codon:yes stop_codon:yes gene_type:complete
MSELFSNLGIDPRLLFAQVVNFILVLWLLNRFVFKKMLTFLDERKKGIEKGVELTAKAEREMERIGEARTRELREVREKAEEILVEAKAKGVIAEREMVAEARQGAEAVVEKAREESERKKQDALKEAQEEIQQRAFVLAEKVLSRSLTKEDEQRMGENLLGELKKS